MIPYERIVQWLAGPISILAGVASVELVKHLAIFGELGVGKDQIASAIITSVTFGVGALVTYLGHAKWMANLTKWWDHQEKTGRTSGTA